MSNTNIGFLYKLMNTRIYRVYEGLARAQTSAFLSSFSYDSNTSDPLNTL